MSTRPGVPSNSNKGETPSPNAARTPPMFHADAKFAGQSCSICQTTVISGEAMVVCPHCELPFHEECWKENRGCSAYGCKSAPPTIKTAEVVPVSNAWGEEKNCPSCNKKIKAEAMKCRFCGAQFESRDVISKEEFASREYEGTEFTAVRNKIILFFFLSAAGCLAPVGLILCGILISQKQLMGIDYRRLPSTLKAMVWVSIGVGALLLFLLALFVVLDR